MLHAGVHLTWAWEPGVVVPLAVSGAWYALGVRAQWERAGRGAVRTREGVCFGLGWATLAAALVSPLHPLGEELLSAHMVQHALLMTVAAPLLVLGRPLVPFLWALPVSSRRRVGRWAKWGAVRVTWRAITKPSVAWLLQAVVLLGWHLPRLYQMTLWSEGVHALQHSCFLVASLLFWWALVHGRGARMGYGMAVVYLFTTMLYSGVLGALMTFSRTVWYPVYAATAPAWGLTPHEDQQLAGLVMWIPAGMSYMIAALVMFALWLRESEGRVLRREAYAPDGVETFVPVPPRHA